MHHPWSQSHNPYTMPLAPFGPFAIPNDPTIGLTGYITPALSGSPWWGEIDVEKEWMW